MQNRLVWFTWGSACVPRVNASPVRTFGVAPKQPFLNTRVSSKSVGQEKCMIARRARQQPRRMHYPLACFSLADNASVRSEEHTSELQSRGHLVCRLLLEKKKTSSIQPRSLWAKTCE